VSARRDRFQDFGDQVDGRVAAWGMAFDDHVDIIDANSSSWMSLTTPELALNRYVRPPQIATRIIWVDTA
jgi:hypothetical protein